MTTYVALRAHASPTSTIEVYVPNRDRDGRVIHNHEHWVDLVTKAVCALTGGGATVYEATGVWRGSYEQTTIVRGAYPAGDDLAPVVDALGAFAEETHQHVSGFTLDGVWYWAVAVPSSA